MSDYLNNIVVRTLGLAPVVQPRLSSLFEPLPVSSGNASIPSFESEATGQYESSRTSTSEVLGRTLVSRADEVQPAVTGHSESREIDRAVSSVDEADTRGRRVETVIRHSPLIPSAPLINARIAPSTLGSRSDSGELRFQAQAHEIHESEVNSSGFADREANGLESSPRRASRVPEIAAEHRDQTRAPSQNAHDRAQPVRARTIHKSPAATALMQPNRLPVSRAQKALADPAISSEVPPTISVTIGRVDVRAVYPQPQVPSVSRAKQSTATSLDEYLKQRNEGRR